MKLDHYDLYQDTQTKRVYAVFPADTDIDYAKKIANRRFKAKYEDLRFVICYKRKIDGKEQIFPDESIDNNTSKGALVRAIWREKI